MPPLMPGMCTIPYDICRADEMWPSLPGIGFFPQRILPLPFMNVLPVNRTHRVYSLIRKAKLKYPAGRVPWPRMDDVYILQDLESRVETLLITLPNFTDDELEPEYQVRMTESIAIFMVLCQALRQRRERTNQLQIEESRCSKPGMKEHIETQRWMAYNILKILERFAIIMLGGDKWCASRRRMTGFDIIWVLMKVSCAVPRLEALCESLEEFNRGNSVECPNCIMAELKPLFLELFDPATFGREKHMQQLRVVTGNGIATAVYTPYAIPMESSSYLEKFNTL
ncbi:uncharacterized protein LAJ45_00971 [Morchella importuna]|uniref:uncharacterized protein n=1 Tax=Morchella importuna TaxID=1174673 RepID=UPI001E8DF56B|nr:uncharacterized protein LAJ45_00971 [Morchella importuna]KAH8154444.1 hypothetical protein LAJ45_00971 [Morchella importuna]